MKKFCKDYMGLIKANNDFIKEHWFGVIVLNVAITGIGVSYIFRDEIKDNLKRKIKKIKD